MKTIEQMDSRYQWFHQKSMNELQFEKRRLESMAMFFEAATKVEGILPAAVAALHVRMIECRAEACFLDGAIDAKESYALAERYR